MAINYAFEIMGFDLQKCWALTAAADIIESWTLYMQSAA